MVFEGEPDAAVGKKVVVFLSPLSDGCETREASLSSDVQALQVHDADGDGRLDVLAAASDSVAFLRAGQGGELEAPQPAVDGVLTHRDLDSRAADLDPRRQAWYESYVLCAPDDALQVQPRGGEPGKLEAGALETVGKG